MHIRNIYCASSHLPRFSAFTAAKYTPTPKLSTPMKTTEQISNEGTYASIQSHRHELSHINEPGKLSPETIYTKQINTPHSITTISKTINNCEPSKWNRSLCGQNTTVLTAKIATPVASTERIVNKAKDWYSTISSTASTPSSSIAAKKFNHINLDLAKEQRKPIITEMSTTAKSFNFEHAALSQKFNHSSSDVKTNAFNRANSIEQHQHHKIEPKQINPQQKLIKSSTSSIEIYRRQQKQHQQHFQTQSFNGNDGHAVSDNAVTESLHKSITTINSQSNLGNSSTSNQTKQTLLSSSSSSSSSTPTSERRSKKQKATVNTKRDEKIKKRNTNGEKINFPTLRKVKYDLAQPRTPLKSNENGGTFDSTHNASNNAERLSDKRMDKEWHSPESYIYDDISITDTTFAAAADCGGNGGSNNSAGGGSGSGNAEFASCMQTFWFRDIPNENLLTREQRLENKRDNLRRQAFQYAQAQHFRSTILAKRRIITVTKALAKFKNERNKIAPTKCSVQSCSNAALAMTAYCYLHITLNKDQKLFHPCTAKFSDNSQCRVPVFDISHELPLCREHAWKRDNYNRISQEQKPKKSLKIKTKTNESVRQPKRNKKKKRRNHLVVAESQVIPKHSPIPPTSQHHHQNHNNHHHRPHHQPQQIEQHQHQHQQQQHSKTIGQFNVTKQSMQPTINVVWNQDLFRKNIENPMTSTPTMTTTAQIISAKAHTPSTHVTTGGNHNKYLPDNVMVYQLSNSMPNASKIKIQNIISVGGENSSAYESSEDTGVGELSESELMTAQDGIEIPLSDARLLEEHDLTNVLNQLPVDAFNDLFQVQQHEHYEPTQKEQDELARALEEVDEQVKSLEQMTSSSNFLESFLDVNDEILDGSDICDEVLTTASVKNDIRGLVHT
ncbi:uncharacterized protein LOC116345428 isoform X2 [Contarinia nasturtii]|uniref:uncharacterized protein LOC116345428 isoform X2 n=1 Tax=Contarinia nasturtii TaxID=265458 RepID=UPI0012D3E1E0|nr:uncharacterized protein LOC116345428 isoform X2 [Contarinia nasturtii]